MKTMILILTLFVSFSAQAQWSSDSTRNIWISDTVSTGNALAPRAVTDGTGGAFIVWGNVGPIRGQRVNANGFKQWGQGGATVGSSREPGFIASLLNPVIISDSSGGAIITWTESSQHTIGASRVGPDSTEVWDRLICHTTGLRLNPALTSDGAGGAIVTWQDTRNGSTNADIYAQRVSATGIAMWDTNGVAICTATGNQELPTIAADGSGGAFIAWQDSRTTIKSIYARRITSLGQVAWRVNGMPIGTTGNPALSPKMVATASGEAIITWTNGNSSGTFDILAQRVNVDTVQWATNGLPVCNAPLSQTDPAIVADGFGGAIISWTDTRISFSDPNIYAQDVSTSGSGQWGVNGIPICTAPDIQAVSAITSDGDGGAIIAWEDNRSGTYYDIYAQRVNRGGGALWTNNGRAVCVAPRDQRSIGIASDRNGGAIITWSDYRNNSYFIVYAQGVRANGSLGGITSVSDERPDGTFRLEQNYPNPFNPTTNIKFQIQNSNYVSLKIFNLLGQEVSTLVHEQLNAGQYEVRFNGGRMASGVYLYRLIAGDQSITKKLLLTK